MQTHNRLIETTYNIWVRLWEEIFFIMCHKLALHLTCNVESTSFKAVYKKINEKSWELQIWIIFTNNLFILYFMEIRGFIMVFVIASVVWTNFHIKCCVYKTVINWISYYVAVMISVLKTVILLFRFPIRNIILLCDHCIRAAPVMPPILFL